MAVKENGAINNRSPYPGPRGRHVQEAALRACLEGWPSKPASAWRSPRPGVGQSRSGRGLSLRFYTVKTDTLYPFRSAIFLAAAYIVRMLPLAGEFRPLRRATRRCPPWTRTGLVSGDRKAARYWASGFGHGAAPAEAVAFLACCLQRTIRPTASAPSPQALASSKSMCIASAKLPFTRTTM